MNSIRCTTCGNPDITKDGEYYVCSVCGNKFLISSVSNNQNNTSNNESSNTILIEQSNEKKKEELLNYIKSHNLEEISEQYIKDIENTEFDDSEKKIIEEKINQLQSKIENALEIRDYKFSIEQYVNWKNFFSDEFKTKLSNIVKEINFPDDDTNISDIYELLIEFLVEMIQYSNDFETSSEFIHRLNKLFKINNINFNNKQIIINDIISKLNKVNSQTNIDILYDNSFYNILTKEQKKDIVIIFLEKETFFNSKSKIAFFKKYSQDVDFKTINKEITDFLFLMTKIDNKVIDAHISEINLFLTNSTNEEKKREIADKIFTHFKEAISKKPINNYDIIIEAYKYLSEEQQKEITNAIKKKEELLNYIKNHNLEEISEQYIKDIENTEFDDYEKIIIEEKIKQLQSKIENAFEIKDYDFSIEQYVKWKNFFSDEYKTKLSNIVKSHNNTDLFRMRDIESINFFIEMIQYSNSLNTSKWLIIRLNHFYKINKIDFNKKQIIINDIISKLKKEDTNIDNIYMLTNTILTQDIFFNILTNEQKKEISNIIFKIYKNYIKRIKDNEDKSKSIISPSYIFDTYFYYLSEEQKKEISKEHEEWIEKRNIYQKGVKKANSSCLLCFLMINIVIIFLIFIIIL